MFCAMLNSLYETLNIYFTVYAIQGVMKHLHLTSRELEEYETEIEKVMRRYVKRLQWLMSGKLG
jgi:hypothetical protein